MEVPSEQPNPKRKTGVFGNEELEFIRLNCDNMTDKEIGKSLGRPENGIARQRKMMGLNKGAGRPKKDGEKATVKNYLLKEDQPAPMRNLTKAERKKLAEKLFEESMDYKRFKKQFTAEEMDVYKDRFSDYLAEWEKILPQEKEQLHTVIKETVIQDRFLKRIKSNEQMKDNLALLENKKIELLLVTDRDKNYHKELESVRKTIQEIKDSMEPVEHIWQDYHKSNERAEKSLKALKLTREQRLKNDEDRGITLVTVVQALNDDKVRKTAGDEAALIAHSTDQYKEWAKKKGIMYGDF